MRTELRHLAAVLCAVAPLLAPAGAAASRGAAPVTRGCASFHSQAEAQEYFLAQGGSPRHRVGGLDPDHDGVACEALGAPYEGYATLGYNFAKSFFYGTVAMPSLPDGSGFACMKGDTHFPEDPRTLNIYRERPGPDRRLLGEYGRGAAALAGTGRLIWKADARLVPGRYYVVFEERVPSKPFGPAECPSFRSATVALGPAGRG